MQPLSTAVGLTEARAKAFAALEIHTVGDLMQHFPFRVEAEIGENTIASHIQALEAKPESERTADISIRGTIAVSRTSFGARPRIEASLEDGTGSARLVFFNMPWMR